jgi:hypothetical protein
MMVIAIIDVGPKHPQAFTPCIHLFHADASALRMASVHCDAPSAMIAHDDAMNCRRPYYRRNASRVFG